MLRNYGYKLGIGLLSIWCLFGAMSQAANPFILEGSIGAVKPEPKVHDPLSFRSIEQWVGENFIFLPKPKSLQKYGYQLIRRKGSSNIFGTGYEKLVGRIATVTDVQRTSIIYTVSLRMDDTGEEYVADAYNETVEGIAPLADLQRARELWIGKTLWYKRDNVATYNADTEQFGSIELKKYSPVKVANVVAGWYETQPVRFIIETPLGEQGFVDINLSGTNVSDILRDNCLFEEEFFEEDPRRTYNWSNQVWTAIVDSKVFIGMTKEQALMSWGKPDKTNRTTSRGSISEQWVYKNNQYLYFEDGLLVSISN